MAGLAQLLPSKASNGRPLPTFGWLSAGFRQTFGRLSAESLVSFRLGFLLDSWARSLVFLLGFCLISNVHDMWNIPPQIFLLKLPSWLIPKIVKNLRRYPKHSRG